jgi:hypothetical protein
MSTSQLRLMECAINAAREAAAGRLDSDTARRVYIGAKRAGVPSDALRPARRFIAAAERAEIGGAL